MPLSQRANLNHLKLSEIFMLGLVARWGHNVLLVAMGLVTITYLVLAR